MIDNISLLLPTRDRPSLLYRLYESIRDTAITNVDLSLYIDNDDNKSLEVANELKLMSTVGPRVPMGKMYNEAYKKAKNDIIMLCSDDLIFRTKGWDVAIIDIFNKYNDKIIMVYANDGVGAVTQPFIHRNWIETLGYVSHPSVSWFYNDSWIDDISIKINRREYCDVLIEHMHYHYGKAQYDSTYHHKLSVNTDDHGWFYKLDYLRQYDAKKLMKFIDEFKNGK